MISEYIRDVIVLTTLKKVKLKNRRNAKTWARVWKPELDQWASRQREAYLEDSYHEFGADFEIFNFSFERLLSRFRRFFRIFFVERRTRC